MSLLRLLDVTKSFGELEVLKGVSLTIDPGDRTGLVGNNGAGKSTLANIITGDLTADAGSLLRDKPNLIIGYLRQDKPYSLAAFAGQLRLEPGAFLAAAGKLGLKSVGKWEEERFKALSGGERTKLALAQVLTAGPDLLLLDEPTNHMDMFGVEWLVEELRGYRGTALIISHDRWFLDQVAGKILELEEGKITEYAGNYSFYRDEKQRRFASLLHRYQVEQKEQKGIEEEIARLRQWSAKGHREAGKESDMRKGVKEYGRKQAKLRDRQIKSRIKLLERKKTEGLERPREEYRPQFEFEAAGKRGRRILEAVDISKSFGNKNLFAKSSFYIKRGEKIGLIGPNGCGKTTLIRVFLQQEPLDGGELWLSPTLRPGYLSQEEKEIGLEQSALEIMGASHKDEVTRVRILLANMGFDAAMAAKPVKYLSLGERTRLKLAAMINGQSDLLLLDEPTNHLDLHSREMLEDTLRDYGGTVIIASHDRYLLEGVCDKLLVFDQGTITRLVHGFRQYRQKTGEKTKARPGGQELLIIETRMAWLVNELGKLSPEDEHYTVLDREYRLLAQKKREIDR